MANPEHVEILSKGIKDWNKWREENPNTFPDLSAQNLDNKELGSYMDKKRNARGSIEYAEVITPNFDNVNFNYSYLSGVSLSGANLRGASFEGAKLRGVDFANTYLEHASFRRTFLYSINFFGARLDLTDFNEARLEYCSFGNNDLSRVKNLTFVKHLGPSSIGLDTIFKSQGNISEKFLRGCGVPEGFITYMRSLTAEAIEFHSCFISYSSKDEEFVRRLYADLQNEGVRCWFAPEDLKIGDRFRVRIDESIRLYDKLVLVLSENSVSSEWVGDEVEAALEKEAGQGGKVALFPLRLDEAVTEIKSGWPAKVRRTRHIGDFSDWKNHDSYKKAFERLMRDLKADG